VNAHHGRGVVLHFAVLDGDGFFLGSASLHRRDPETSESRGQFRPRYDLHKPGMLLAFHRSMTV
jgi:hypothetical protein